MLFFEPTDTRGYVSKRLTGQFSLRNALKRLLENTHLTFEVTESHVVFVRPDQRSQTATKQPNSQPSLTIEEVSIIGHLVTGSRIPRTEISKSTPIDFISQEELRRSGAQTLSDFIRFIPAVSGNSTSTAVANGGDGTSTITLRGLPANNTLVLINGQRAVFDGLAGESVDLNAIPTSAVARVEILKDGASAIYGTDAIAGVVNIILKEEYDGFRAEQYYGQSNLSDLETQNTALQWGKSNSSSGFITGLNYYDQAGLFSRDRDVSRSADGRRQGGIDRRSSSTPNARISLSDGRVVTFDDDAGNLLDGLQPDDFRDATPEDLFNFREFTSSISPSERWGAFFNGYTNISDEYKLTASAIYSKTDATITLAPTPITTAFLSSPITLSATNAFNIFNQDLADVRRRVIELGPRLQRNRSESFRLSSAIDYTSNAFHWNLNAYWSKSIAEQSLSNLLNEERARQALGPLDECNLPCTPLDLLSPSGSISDSQLEFVRAQNKVNGFSVLSGANFAIGGELTQFSSGALQGVFGGEVRHEESVLNPVVNTTNIGGVLSTATQGRRTIVEFYSEIHIPLLSEQPFAKSLNAELAFRFSNYSDFGENLSPKFSIHYQPATDLTLRSSYSRGFRAPSIDELFRDGELTQAFIEDPCARAENVDRFTGCTQQSDPLRTQFLTEFTGDENLQPEESENFSLGVVWIPDAIEKLELSVDTFLIKQTNVIDANPQNIVNLNAEQRGFSGFVERDQNGEITRVTAPFINIGERDVQGLDVVLHKQFPKFNLGVSVNATRLFKFTSTDDNGEREINLAGRFVDAASEGNGALPEWKANTGFNWRPGKLNVTYTLHYVSSLIEDVPNSRGAQRKISSWITQDIQASYSLSSNQESSITLGVDNLFDRQPPFSASAFNDNIDSRTFDLIGRFYYIKVAYAF